MAKLNNIPALLVLVLSLFLIITIAESRPVFHGKLSCKHIASCFVLYLYNDIDVSCIFIEQYLLQKQKQLQLVIQCLERGKETPVLT